MATGEFDIGATLRKRLQEITQKKESIAVSYFIFQCLLWGFHRFPKEAFFPISKRQ